MDISEYKLRHEPNMLVFDHPQLMMLDWDDLTGESKPIPLDTMLDRVKALTLPVAEETNSQPEEGDEAAPDAYSRNCHCIWHCTSAGHQQVVDRLIRGEGIWAIYKTFGGSRALRLDQPVPVPSQNDWEELVRLYECDPLYVYQAAKRGHWAARVSHKLDKDGNLRPEKVRLTHLVGEGVPHLDLVKLAAVHHRL